MTVKLARGAVDLTRARFLVLRLREATRMKRQLPLFAMLCVVATSGCTLPSGILRSRWAMDDPDYAAKYAEGAEKTDIRGKLKQAVDARFQNGSSGMFVSGGAYVRPDSQSGMGAIDVGVESYVTSYLTTRGSLTLFAGGGDLFTGLDLGMRLQSPSRLAPFAGAGTFAGYAREVVPADDDWIDNDEDGFIDEHGEDRERFSGFLLAVYPEVGTHFWWTPNIRLTGFGRYLVTTEGRDDDDWLIGGGVALFSK